MNTDNSREEVLFSQIVVNARIIENLLKHGTVTETRKQEILVQFLKITKFWLDLWEDDKNV